MLRCTCKRLAISNRPDNNHHPCHKGPPIGPTEPMRLKLSSTCHLPGLCLILFLHQSISRLCSEPPKLNQTRRPYSTQLCDSKRSYEPMSPQHGQGRDVAPSQQPSRAARGRGQPCMEDQASGSGQSGTAPGNHSSVWVAPVLPQTWAYRPAHTERLHRLCSGSAVASATRSEEDVVSERMHGPPPTDTSAIPPRAGGTGTQARTAGSGWTSAASQVFAGILRIFNLLHRG
jgi:hypothetical protein